QNVQHSANEESRVRIRSKIANHAGNRAHYIEENAGNHEEEGFPNSLLHSTRDISRIIVLIVFDRLAEIFCQRIIPTEVP
ncbi:hypothetical protein PFISCL1PPCAC_4954, partial [Pristionchus fissidentatus]